MTKRSILAAVLLGVALFSCAKVSPESDSSSGGPAELAGSCRVAMDQMATFTPPLRGLPTRIVADEDFDSEERDGIERAVQMWNRVGEATNQRAFFELQFGTIPRASRNADPRGCSQLVGGSDYFFIIRETDEGRWKGLQFGETIPGSTIRCWDKRERNFRRQLAHQVLYLNPRITHPRQFSTVVGHELGHAVGLEHSCDPRNQGRRDFRSCADLPPQHAYLSALMYPTLQLPVQGQAPETKESLNENDLERVNCLYGR